MALRKELLERELSRLGFRKGEAGRADASDTSGGQQESQAPEHPQADADAQDGE